MISFIRIVDQSPLTKESLTTELISKASLQFFSDNTVSSFTNFLPEQLNLESQWEFPISEMFYASKYQIFTERRFMFFDKKFSISSQFYYLEPGLYSSTTDIVKAMNTLFHETQNHSENCIIVKASGRTQKS